MLATGYWFVNESITRSFFLFVILYFVIRIQFIHRGLPTRIVTGVVGTGVLIGAYYIFYLLALANAFGNHSQALDTWEYNDYKITYSENQGFVGGNYNRYSLRHYALNRIVVKYWGDGFESENSECVILFKEHQFNKCINVVSKMN